MFRIILVDDESLVINALTRCLRRTFVENATVEGFTDPTAALARISETPVDVIVSDYRMPEMDGVTLLKEVAKIQPDTTRLILSATEDFNVLVTAINDAAITRFLSKPWDEEVLISVIRKAAETTQQRRAEKLLADERRLDMRALSPQELEKRRLEQQEPGLTHVNWGPNGEVILELDESDT